MRTHTRGTALIGAIAASALILAGCSSGTSTAADPTSLSQPAGPATITVASLNQTQKDPNDWTAGYDTTSVDVQVPVNPQRVVVLDSTVIEALNGMGVPATQVVGASKWGLEKIAPDYAVDAVTDVSSADGRGYDLEKIAALNPDLIITGWRGTASAIPGLADIDVTKIELSPAEGHTVESLRTSTTTLGAIFDRPDQAAALTGRLDKAVADAQAATSAPGTGSGVVLLTTGGSLSGVSATGARFGILYNDFGLQVNPELEKVVVELANKVAEGAQHGWELSSEAILAANPDWLVVIDRDAAIGQAEKPAAQILDNELIKQTTAGSTGRIVYLDPVGMYTGEGIVSYTAAGEQIAREITTGGTATDTTAPTTDGQ